MKSQASKILLILSCFMMILTLVYSNDAIEEKCKEKCEYGVCNQGKCYCNFNYGGVDCSKNHYRMNKPLIAFTILLFIIKGLLIGYGIFYLIRKCTLNNQATSNANDLQIKEDWNIDKPQSILD